MSWRAKLEVELGLRELALSWQRDEATVKQDPQRPSTNDATWASVDPSTAAAEAAVGAPRALSAASACAAASLPPPQPGAPPLLLTGCSTVAPGLLACLPSLNAVRHLRSTTSSSAYGTYCPSTSALLAAPVQYLPQRPLEAGMHQPRLYI